MPFTKMAPSMKSPRSIGTTRSVARIVCLCLTALMLGGCPRSVPPQVAGFAPSKAESKKAVPVSWRMSASGKGFRLSNADPAPPEKKKLAPTKPLGREQVKRYLAALPPLRSAAQKKAFSFRDKAPPAPRPGETISTPFPPANQAPRPAAAPARTELAVERYAPEGQVPLAPELSVTFSLPMVDITSHAELSQRPLPVRLSPEPAGKWRWIGSQTLLFQPKERFPMASDFAVEIPKGTTAVSGASLKSAKRFSFSTPPLKLIRHYPANGAVVDLAPVFHLKFDQRVDSKALLPSIVLEQQGKPVALRLATQKEIEADKKARYFEANAPVGRWLALKAEEPLAKNSSFSLTIARGAPSAEGPKRTSEPQRFSFRTYGPMKLTEVRCGWRGECPPLTAWTLTFSNAIDVSSFDEQMVHIEPPLADLDLEVYDRNLRISGRSEGGTTYSISLDGSLKDSYGQTLEQPAEVRQAVGHSEPRLFIEPSHTVLLDPAARGKLSVFSINQPPLNLRLYKVKPSDFPRYLEYRSGKRRRGEKAHPPGRLVFSGQVKTNGKPDALTETLIDLNPALNAGIGHVIAIVEGTKAPKRGYRSTYQAWVQATELSLHAFIDNEQVYGWVTTLADGKAVGGAELGVAGLPNTAKTTADGLARLVLGQTGDIVYAKRDQDVVFAPPHWLRRAENLVRRIPEDRLRWFSFDDRGLYKPGETLHLKGYIRTSGTGRGGDIRTLPNAAAHHVRYSARGPRGNKLGEGSVRLQPDASFYLSLKLPSNANLGSASLLLQLAGPAKNMAGAEYQHAFQIQEFRRPEYEVKVQVSQGPYFVGGHAIATVTAKYYAGGGLPGAEVNWQVSSRDAFFKPPHHPSYHFGKPPESWWDPQSFEGNGEVWPALTDATGAHRLRIDFDGLSPAFARTCHVGASVTDVNRQGWWEETEFLVHPADAYVGVRTKKSFARLGEAVRFDLIASDIDGNVVPGQPITARLSRMKSEFDGEKWVERELDSELCEVVSKGGPSQCELLPKKAGLHRLSAVVTDAHGRKSETRVRLWVTGGHVPKDPKLEPGQVQIIPDQQEYAQGDQAKLLVLSPFAPAEGVLTVRRQGIVRVTRFSMKETNQVINVPIDPSYTPNVQARVDLVGVEAREGAHGRGDPALRTRPAVAWGQVELKVPPTDRTLSIDIKPERERVKPGASTQVSFKVTEASGRAVKRAWLAAIVVDESVLSLSGYELPDPLSVFYADRPADVRDFETRLQLVLAGERALADKTAGEILATRTRGLQKPVSAVLSADEADTVPYISEGKAVKSETAGFEAAPAPSEPVKPFKLRSDFGALAAFLPHLVTDERGRATARIKLPDSLTRYRVMVVADVGQNQFGSAEGSIVAGLPLMVRPSPPRFLNFGDRFELPIAVQNHTARSRTVNVVARGSNLALLGTGGVQVVVPANDRVEVLLPAAADRPGRAVLQVGAAAVGDSDASEQTLPVYTPATTEAFATYGQIDQGSVAQSVRVPKGALRSFGGLELTTASTALQGLTDAVLYLVSYPFECTEQIASRLLALTALKDVLGAFEAEGLPPPERLAKSVKRDLELLKARQHRSGGWDYWSKQRTPVPYLSVHVAHALVRAKDKGYPVPEHVLRRGLAYLERIESNIPKNYSAESRQAITAYALYVRSRAGDHDSGAAQKLIQQAGGVTQLPIEAIGWLLRTLRESPKTKVYLDQARRHLKNRVTETAGTAHFVTSYSDGAQVLLHSSRRADGVLLEALLDDEPQNGLIPKLARGLLAHRKRGHWRTTQENAFVLLALGRYFDQFENVSPGFLAQAWLGPNYALEHRFVGRSIDRQHVDIPMQVLQKQHQPIPLLLEKKGPGRLYYRLGMQYAPKNLELFAADHGFAVDRTYEAIDDPGDVRRQKDGTWRIKAGAKVRVRVTMVARGRRYHVALVDPIPAGFEAMNPALANTEPVEEEEYGRGVFVQWQPLWYEHQNLRDERVEAFASLLRSGVHELSYVARATTPGRFVVPPAKAEEMYAPETFGRSASDRVTID